MTSPGVTLCGGTYNDCDELADCYAAAPIEDQEAALARIDCMQRMTRDACQ